MCHKNFGIMAECFALFSTRQGLPVILLSCYPVITQALPGCDGNRGTNCVLNFQSKPVNYY